MGAVLVGVGLVGVGLVAVEVRVEVEVEVDVEVEVGGWAGVWTATEAVDGGLGLARMRSVTLENDIGFICGASGSITYITAL